MKQKIRIMKKKEQPSDEEIQQYMNFDRLLDSRKIALSATRNATVLKWGGAAVTVVAVVAIVIMFNNPPTEVREENQNRQDTSQIVQHLSQNVVPDTLKDEDRSQSSPANEGSRVAEETKKVKPSSGEKAIEKSSGKVASQEITESGYVQAEPVNGYAELYNYFNTNLVYPTEGLKDSVQGVQTISFIINKDGKPEQIEVVKSLGDPFEKESKRLIENMPGWQPATLNGKPVASKISLPLTFQIQKIKK